ncbi:MAG: Hemerythrin cation binding domain protein [Clostridia bacterium]|nr:Hemerythrin cation binding domain protein [Clostridia bacterium]
MANINNLERQHKEIYTEIQAIKKLIGHDTIAEDSSELAKMISLLAGKLKMHLQSEDKFLYPGLLESDRTELRQLAKDYINDMGAIHNEFEKYKFQFNTKNKIDNDMKQFRNETEQIFKILENRLNKEDHYLYPLIRKDQVK